MKLIILLLLGISLLQAKYIRDNATEVVLDTTTNLMWQDTNETRTLAQDFNTSVAYCSALDLGGYTDWVLPNDNELLTLVDRTLDNPSINSTFENIDTQYYWTSTICQDDHSRAWNIYFGTGLNSKVPIKANTLNHARCVRSIRN